MTRVQRRDVVDGYIAEHCIVASGKLTGVDLDAAEREIAAAARHDVPRLAADLPRLRRHQTAVRQYYLSGGHLQRRDG
jgi:hypothetical protein